ncbi:hypothetical protein similar to RNA binding domain-containing protein [Blumeria hordei DH14]|uniref:RRM domain-containing protein n=1 Tax=Blumeria graminis f. sp. hordei (strain DH14) TaxID=546991 RepID=N1JFX9_BLUG1|nr:hypothetical protein similar to RNA binding domain-containing protein [Blumeria hordei DH14]
MDRALDEIVAESHNQNRTRGRFQGRRGGRKPERIDYPREGVRKSRRDDSRNIDSEWVHDKFDDHTIGRRTGRTDRRFSPTPDYESPSAKLRVENLHYDLTEDDLDDLFNRIGPVISLSLIYDRAGRSEGIAYVTYESPYDAKKAIQEFDGANAKGQPIRLISIPSGPSRRRNPPPGRSLFERITPVSQHSKTTSNFSNVNQDRSTSQATEAYVSGKQSYTRSPRPPRNEGHRPGMRKDRGERLGMSSGRDRLARDGRPKKTQEELDAEMEDYWGANNNVSTELNASGSAGITADDQMIE